MQSRSKQLTIGVLLLLTLVLAAASIFIALSLRGTPDTSVAACTEYAAQCTGKNNGDLVSCTGGQRCRCVASLCADKITQGLVMQCVGDTTCGGTGTTCNNNGTCDAGETTASCVNDCPASTGGGFSPKQCTNGTTSATTWCLIFNCPNGDTNGDGKCQAGDTGATQTVSTNEAQCDTVPNGCYQVDYYKQTPAATSNATDANFCHFRLNLNCQPGGDDVTPQNPRFNIRKNIAENAGNVFRVGDTIPFRIVITNTGNVPFTTLRFRDSFDKDYLEFIDGTVTFRNQSATITTADLNAETGNINIENILARLNNLNFRPDDEVLIRLNFEAIQATEELTRNRAFAKAGDEDEEEDNEDVEVVEEDELICGDDCTATTQCPTNHTCSSGSCVLNSCLSNPDACSANGCQLLPDTGILDEPFGLILVGSVLILLGLLAYQINLPQAAFAFLLANNKKAAIRFIPESSEERELLQQQIKMEEIKNRKLSKERNRKSYEDKFRV